MRNDTITTAAIDELLAFLPIFKDTEFVPVIDWNPWPVYTQETKTFFALAARPCWQDYGYLNAAASKKIDDDAFIAAASLDDIKTMLTLCVRSERFSDGSWAHFLESGRIVVLLHRLQAIKRTW